ncbi:hypothetical protein SDRG_16161 [Saprolegnia diclina VS20]|uniref:Uncharacterized protein n=1 Tax=Saprolegnia diclina (strain VS20) TaxID=1156394 RepID=T0PKY9_SAPDV|nr:hypothetical protein SDRG_16161 [Saprolegnia diclina VS20]EQC26014.1 hypothetical protein SDRG_16161 [Saprolegnia diclina VS20]|eukprot:XP_008620582.1 hypothetical protein SDRG_16161 [Saprolegnia diclina VS20]
MATPEAETTAYELDATELALAAWIKTRSAKEAKRLQKMGVKCIPLGVKNMAIVREDNDVVLNRVEVDTAFSMNLIEQIMVADERRDVPDKAGYVYVNVLLLAKPASATKQPVALVMPYVYDASVSANTLTQWVFINNDFERSQHIVEAYT